MARNSVFMEELNKYYAVWQEYNYVYEEWAKAHGLSVTKSLKTILIVCLGISHLWLIFFCVQSSPPS